MKASREYAVGKDSEDPVKTTALFHIPELPKEAIAGTRTIYLCGNSLGLQPISTKSLVTRFLEKWAREGVEGHFNEPEPWLTIDDTVIEPMANLIGAKSTEVAIMNSLTANLHFMMASFYRPSGMKSKILIEGKAFPSDIHAVKSQIQHHGLDPNECLLEIHPKDGSILIDDVDILDTIRSHKESLALILLSGVQYYTGQLFDLSRICQVAHECGCIVGFDLAHAVGNVSLELHDWGCDFACWCTYKYLNSGPGSIGGCFVHEKHGYTNDARQRLSGWWGHRLEDRFLMSSEFIPAEGAYGYRVSNPSPILIACVKSSLNVFQEVSH
jgi:kynureninase